MDSGSIEISTHEDPEILRLGYVNLLLIRAWLNGRITFSAWLWSTANKGEEEFRVDKQETRKTLGEDYLKCKLTSIKQQDKHFTKTANFIAD